MEYIENPLELPTRYAVEAVARFAEWVVTHHPDGAAWAHLPALLRAHPDRFFCVPSSARIVDLIGIGHASHARP